MSRRFSQDRRLPSAPQVWRACILELKNGEYLIIPMKKMPEVDNHV
jgi:hypothetical protein